MKRRQEEMTPTKQKRRTSIVEVGTGLAKVTIYSCNRKDGFSEFTLAWKEGGCRRRRSLSCLDEARIVAQQISVRLTNGRAVGDEVSKRDLELLEYCEELAGKFGVSLSVAIEEWAGAKKIAGKVSILDAIRSHMASRNELSAVKSIKQVAEEFVESRRILVTMFGFIQRQGYLPLDKKTAASLSESFKVPDTEILIFTPEEMLKLLLHAPKWIQALQLHARLLDLRSEFPFKY